MPASALLALFALIAMLMAADLGLDLGRGAGLVHLTIEVAVMVAALGGAAVLARRMRGAQQRAARLHSDLSAARAEAMRFREEARDALRGLGAAIDQQFARWELTPSEREVGMLLLKGLSHKEVAEVRGTTEGTVRQQALALYRKSGLGGRSELAAFFLEDLLLPRTPEPGGEGPDR